MNISARPSPNSLTIKFPLNFTILRHRPEFTEQYTDDNFVIFKWPASTTHNVQIRFHPFCVRASIKSLKFTIDIPTAFPTKGFLKATYEERIQTPKQFSIWDVDPITAVYIAFPGYSKELTIENVWDGMGACKEILEPVEEIDANSLGNYYVDYNNRKVHVYTRYHYAGGSYEYYVGATFVTSSEYKPFEMEGIKETNWPFRFESYLIIDEVLETPYWELDITGNLEVKFILPPNSEPLKSESGNPEVGVEAGRPVAWFVHVSPGAISQGRWRVVYDLIPLRNFFWLEVASTIALFLIWLSLLKLPLKIGLSLFGAFTLPLFAFNFYSFIGLGGSKAILSALFLAEIVAMTLMVIALVIKQRRESAK